MQVVATSSSSSSPVLPPVSIAAQTRICVGCSDPIPQVRLRAVPSARYCVPCQESIGDVPLLRRYDDVGQDGEVHETYFTDNVSLEQEMHRRNCAAEHTVRFIAAENLEHSTSMNRPDPENTSVQATNLGGAVMEQGHDLLENFRARRHEGVKSRDTK